ncbi:MAG: carotenoid biosynthesis protein [Myxococcales bacterium]
MTLWPLELACVAILAVYAFLHRHEPGWLREVAWLIPAALLGEDTCIRAYGFYQYAPGWHLRVDHVPLLIATIWPAVVLSARAIARLILKGRGGTAGLAALSGVLVVFDAALIEPVAVTSGLWSWNAPGIFAVPPVGILGWGFFAAASVYVLERVPARASGVVVIAAPLLTHLALLASWWGLLRWLPQVSFTPAAGIAFVALCSLLYFAAVRRSRAGLPRNETLARVAATSFFGFLLATHPEAWLLGYAAAFVPPYLLLSFQGWAPQPARPASPASPASPADPAAPAAPRPPY